MKTKIFSSLLVLCVSILGTSCTSDMEYKDVNVTSVQQLYTPKDNVGIELQASATASVFFEWASALAEDGISPQYEVLFDKVGGDFLKPVYSQTSDDMGLRSYATISHKTLDKVAQLAGFGSGEKGSLVWTVRSSRGVVQQRATVVRTLTVTRLLGFTEIPAQLFITGEGSEGGTDVSKALAFASPASGEFMIFTKLEAGKKYHFVSGKDTEARVFYTESGKLKESSTGDGAATVSETGIYRINLDFNISTVAMAKVVSLGWFFSPSNKVDIALTYQGNGIWKGTGRTEFHQEAWGRDERYKFEMVYDRDGTRLVSHWGPTNPSLDNRPGDNEDPAYFNMQEWPTSQWNNKWKLHGKFDNQMTTFTVYLNGEGVYRHTVELAQ